MRRILLHRLAGVLSAYGMGLADLRLLRQRAVEAPLGDALRPELQRVLAELEREGVAEMTAQGVASGNITILRRLHLKYEGTDLALVIPFGETRATAEAFAAAHRARFGFDVPDGELIVEAVSVEVVGAGETPGSPRSSPVAAVTPPAVRARRAIWFGAAAAETPIYSRDDLEFGHMIAGPAVIIEAAATTVVEPGWRASVDRLENLLLDRVEALPRRMAVGTDADPVMLEVFGNLYMSIAEQMGVALQSTSRSVNIKERLDYSCAVFDRDGALIANAPHMPIHLGSMGESVKVIIAARQRERDGRGMLPGDVYALNAPWLTAAPTFRISQSSCLCSTAEAKPRRRARLSRSSIAASCGGTISRHRRHHARLHAAGQPHDHGGGRAHRQLPARRCQPLLRDGDPCALAQRPLPVAQSGPEHRRSQSTGRGLACQGRGRVAADGLGSSVCRWWSACHAASCRIMPQKRFVAFSMSCATESSRMRWMTGP